MWPWTWIASAISSGSPWRLPISAASAGRRGRSLEIARGLVAEHGRQQSVAVHGGLLRHVLEQPVGAGQPAARGPHRPAVGQRHPDPARAVRGAERLPPLEVGVMRPLEDLDRLVVASEHARGRRAQLEIRGRERLGLVRAGERLVRLEPGALGVRGAGALEVGLSVLIRPSSCNSSGDARPDRLLDARARENEKEPTIAGKRDRYRVQRIALAGTPVVERAIEFAQLTR